MCQERVATDAYEAVTGALPTRPTARATWQGPHFLTLGETLGVAARHLGLEPRVAQGSRNRVETRIRFSARQLG
jgi:hypothetical protein